jgi:hypothetical protein
MVEPVLAQIKKNLRAGAQRASPSGAPESILQA